MLYSLFTVCLDNSKRIDLHSLNSFNSFESIDLLILLDVRPDLLEIHIFPKISINLEILKMHLLKNIH
jgi:hypothetical protein